MDSALVTVTRSFLTVVWRLFTSWDVPGTNITPAELLLGFLVSLLAFRFILSLFHTESSSDLLAVDSRFHAHDNDFNNNSR